MEWLSDFVTPSIWDVIPFAALLGGGAVIGAIKKLRTAWGAPLLYGVVGGGVIFICLSLVSLSNRHMETLERIGGEQIEELERTGDKQTKALEELSNEQGEILNELIRANPTRPYFTQTLAEIYKVSEGTRYLTVSVQNNNISAENVVSHLLVLEEALKSNAETLHSSRVEIANPIGSGGTHNHHWGPVNVPPNARPAFVVLQVQYSHALSNALYSQSLFLKFRGTSQDGTYIEQLFNATSDEKTKIMRYMEKRGISAL